jgi:predicted ArsR family transcriptional regulator
MQTTDIITMSQPELTRLQTIVASTEGRLSALDASKLLKVTTRRIRRLMPEYEALGASSLVSKRRGRPSNNQVCEDPKAEAMALVCTLPGFWPKRCQ